MEGYMEWVIFFGGLFQLLTVFLLIFISRHLYYLRLWLEKESLLMVDGIMRQKTDEIRSLLNRIDKGVRNEGWKPTDKFFK